MFSVRPREDSMLWSQADYDEREEFARSVKLSLLGVSPSGPASFQPSQDTLSTDWDHWVRTVFGEIIGPVFSETCQLAAKLKLREIAVLDWMLGEQLGEKSLGLIEASRPFIEGKEKMRGHREWRKYILKLESGEAPGHLPVIFALHSVLFRLPLTCALQSYAWFEWKSGYHSIGKWSLAGYPEDPPEMFLQVKEQIVRIISPDLEGGSEPELRVV